ncbi:MAG TPA: SGNH/GDSL hydrolase family protein [Mucilaginibacter sp.]
MALGDSYTVGRTVPTESSFPYQLVQRLRDKKIPVSAPVVIAQNGWRTDELIKGIIKSGNKKTFDIVTLLIGVNNQFQNINIDIYRTEFVQLLNTAIAFARGNSKHVFVLSIPDWGVTPFAFTRNPDKIALQIDNYNEINKQETEAAGAVYVDITTLSRLAADDRSLVSTDNLHPSAKMYELWVKKISREIIRQIKK